MPVIFKEKPKVPIKLTRRTVSVVRDFPIGCGTKVSLNPNPPLVQSESRAEEGDNAGPSYEESGSFKVEKCGYLNCVDSENPQTENVLKLGSLDEEQEEEEEKQSCLIKCVNGDVTAERCDGTGVIGRKSWRVSAVRDFPDGCGRAASEVCMKESSGIELIDSLKSETLDNGSEMQLVLYTGKLPEEERDEIMKVDGNREIVYALMAAENCPWRNGRIRIRKSCSRASRPFTPKPKAKEDREIVCALMAAENCPWMKGRKSGETVSRSIPPKFKSKELKRLLGSNIASSSRRASAYLHENSMDMKGEEDYLPQDDGNELALTIYKGSRDLCITMTPSTPYGLFSDGSSSNEAASRSMVKRTLRMFQLICRRLLRGEEKEKGKLLPGMEENTEGDDRIQRVDSKAAHILKESNQWVNQGDPIIGHVPGVEVGDEFHYRVELSIIGVHRPPRSAIDCVKKDGMVLATSVVVNGGYPDDIGHSDILIYSDSGGKASSGGDKQASDQKLERRNLPLKNSKDAQTPVRVVYSSKELMRSDSQDTKRKLVTTFTYDGLYIVEDYWKECEDGGPNVFKFQLRRMPGQPEISLREVKKTKTSKVREGLCVKDISDGKETIPICAVNTVDSDLPVPFKYIREVIYPSLYVKKPPRGCDCTDGCSDSEKCACAVKNGGEIPFNFDGAIVEAKPLVYECGPSCKCPPSCHNRVSQHGIKLPLEIFKTSKMGWGVRSLYSIPSGTFVCEYVGEMLDEQDAERRVNDEYLFDIGQNYDDHTLWEGLSTSIPGLQPDVASETVKDVGFTIDAAEYGNVGRFINHNCSPNLYAQNLLYDHDDKEMPHVMFFAIDNIPPLQELTYHYNYNIDQVRDPAGNIKKKECFCGSSECTGRLY